MKSLAVALALVLCGCGRPPLRFPVERTEARLERGRYLVTSVGICFHCHSERDWQTPPGGLPMAGKAGAGRVLHPGFSLTYPNLTPDRETGAGSWPDEDIYRALTRGIGHDGRILYTEMPYAQLSQLSDEDIAAIIVYLRSLAPIRHVLPKSEIPDSVKARLQPLPPRPPGFTPDVSTPEKRGAYLVAVAACVHCHTPQRDGADITDLPFAGGTPFNGAWGQVSSANLTPDPSGIPYYDEHMLEEVIHTGMNGARKINPVMPWPYLRGLKDDDVRDIFAFLGTLPPVQHHLDNGEPGSFCKKCDGTHGLGERN